MMKNCDPIPVKKMFSVGDFGDGKANDARQVQPEAEAMLEQRAVFSAPSLSVYLNDQPTAVA